MRIHTTTLQSGISRTREFEKKGLASFAVNVGTKCGHGCLYCSSGAILRMHPSFKDVGENPFESGYAIMDPETPSRIHAAACQMKNRGLIQLCTTVDAWSPEAQEHDLGRKCLETILAQPDWMVRILTKNAAVIRDFDLISKYKERVLVGLSITATEDQSDLISIIEPNASSISERIEAMQTAHWLGLRTYAMFCPLLPGIATEIGQIEELMQLALECGAEEIFVEPVNSRGPGLKKTEEALRTNGYEDAADKIAAIRRRKNWSGYVKNLLETIQTTLQNHQSLNKLRFLLYPANLAAKDKKWIRTHDKGVRWLGSKS